MRILIAALAGFLAFAPLSTMATAQSWDEVIDKARGQLVFWDAWGGDERINAYIAWAGDQVQARCSYLNRSTTSRDELVQLRVEGARISGLLAQSLRASHKAEGEKLEDTLDRIGQLALKG